MALKTFDTIVPQGDFPGMMAQAVALPDGRRLDAAHAELVAELGRLNGMLTAFLDSDEQSLDQLSEIITFIQGNKTLIEGITTSKVSYCDIVNDLTTQAADKPLSAAMGAELARQVEEAEQAAVPEILPGAAVLEPEKHYDFGAVDELAVTLVQKNDGRAHEYWFQFQPKEGFPGLTIAPEVKWVSDPQYPVGKTCLVGIVMGMAVMAVV